MISSLETGVAKSCSIVPRSHSREMVSAVRSDATIAKMSTMRVRLFPAPDYAAAAVFA